MVHRGVSLRFFSLFLCFVLFAATEEPLTTTNTTTSTTPTTTGTTSETIQTSTPTTPNHTTQPPTTPIETPTTNTTMGTTSETNQTSTPTTTSNSTTSTSLTTPVAQTCSSNSCPTLAVCTMNRQKSAYWCECPVGYNLAQGSCISVKVFTSMLHWNDNFTNAMNDKTSEEFKKIQQKTENKFETVYVNTSGYIGVEVLNVSAGSVKVLTSCKFSKESTMNDSYFNTMLKQVNDSEPYKRTCDLKTCDKKTTKCSYKDGIVSCDCRDGYVPSSYSNVNCIVCEPGQKAVNKKCEPCPFGYSGINCNDASLLEVVIISVVLGFIILVLIIFIIVGCCVKKKQPENTYSNQGWQHNAGFSNNSPGIPRNNSLLMGGDRPSRKQSFSNPSFKKECDHY